MNAPAGSGWLPLTGVTVLDFTHGVAGPYGTMLLADLGATVWKVEKPGRGDATRYMNVSSAFAGDIPASGGDYFLAINRNKYSIGLDLATGRGRDIALRLAEHADVVASSFRPGVMDRLGLGAQRVRERNPRAVYATLTAYGQRGPLAGHPGMDVAVQARSGVMSITGYPGSDPVKPGASLADFAGGVHLSNAVLAALYRRAATGTGGEVTVSLLDATMSMLSNYSVAVLDGGVTVEPMGSGHPQLVPFRAFPTADGHVVIATGTNRLYTQLCRVLDAPELAADPRFRTNVERVAHRDDLERLLAERTVTRSTAQWLDLFEREGIPCAPVNTLRDAFTDPQLRANNMIQQVRHPALGPIHQLGSPYVIDGHNGDVRRPPPRLGADTEELLGEVLGLTAEQIAGLRDEEVV